MSHSLPFWHSSTGIFPLPPPNESNPIAVNLHQIDPSFSENRMEIRRISWEMLIFQKVHLAGRPLILWFARYLRTLLRAPLVITEPEKQRHNSLVMRALTLTTGEQSETPVHNCPTPSVANSNLRRLYTTALNRLLETTPIQLPQLWTKELLNTHIAMSARAQIESLCCSHVRALNTAIRGGFASSPKPGNIHTPFEEKTPKH